MARKGGIRSDDQRKAMFASMAKRTVGAGDSKIPASPSPNSFLGVPIPEFKGDDEERKFLESYPVDKLVIPPKLKSLGFLKKCKDCADENGTSTLSNVTQGKNLKKSKELLKDFEQKGYLQFSDKENDTEIRVLPWGYAQAVKDQKGEYAKELESKYDLEKARELAKKERQRRIEDAEQELIKYRKELEDFYGKDEQLHEEEDEEIKHDINRIKALKSDELVILPVDEESKKLADDVRYVLDTYFDIDPSILSENVLEVILDTKHKFTGCLGSGFDSKIGRHDFTLNISTKDPYYQHGDVKNDELYLGTLMHELTHWIRDVDMRRAVIDKSTLSHVRSSEKEPLKEETHTVLESVMRLGNKHPKGDFSYYTKLQPGGIVYKEEEFADNPAGYDNTILTMEKEGKSENSLSQIAENLVMRLNATKLSLLGLDSKGRWIDTRYPKKSQSKKKKPSSEGENKEE